MIEETKFVEIREFKVQNPPVGGIGNLDSASLAVYATTRYEASCEFAGLA